MTRIVYKDTTIIKSLQKLRSNVFFAIRILLPEVWVDISREALKPRRFTIVASTLSKQPSIITSPILVISSPSSIYLEWQLLSSFLPETKYSMTSSVLDFPALFAPIRNVASPKFISTSFSLRKFFLFSVVSFDNVYIDILIVILMFFCFHHPLIKRIILLTLYWELSLLRFYKSISSLPWCWR